MFYVLTFIGWCVFNAYSGFTLIVLWIIHEIFSGDDNDKKEKG